MIVGGGVMFSNDRGNTSAGSVGLILAGIGALVFYLYSRKHTCIVASDGGSRMVFSTTNMKRIALIDFIDKVEEAKLKRVQAGFQSFDK